MMFLLGFITACTIITVTYVVASQNKSTIIKTIERIPEQLKPHEKMARLKRKSDCTPDPSLG